MSIPLVVGETIMIFKYHFLLIFLFIFLSAVKSRTASSICLLYRGGSTLIDPYHTLQISKSASLDEIRKSYKQLCKKYHPDKHTNALTNEKKIFEARFKDIQHAYSLIGDRNARQRYDSLYTESYRENVTSRNHINKSSHYSQPHFDKKINFYDNIRPFYVNGVDISPLFSPMVFLYRNYETKKSIYIQDVDVPLEELYMGVTNKKITLRNVTLCERYRAALRGNIFGIVFFQSFLTSFPILIRSGWVLSSIIFFTVLHIGLPTPKKVHYKANILCGWKDGTKLTFNEPNLDIVFILREKAHCCYKRKENDLLSSVTIRKTQAKKGCTILLAPLGITELPIEVKLKPEQIIENGQTIVIRGRGWPKRVPGIIKQKGNLLVVVKLVSNGEISINRRNDIQNRRDPSKI